MRKFLLFIILSLRIISADTAIDEIKLKIIEEFLSSMNTLEAEITMDINEGKVSENYQGKIWLDRRNMFLRIDYGENKYLARNGTLTVKPKNERPQEFATEDTPAGILLKPSINFKSEGIAVRSLAQTKDLWQLCLSYDSPAGSIPVTLYFKPKPVMLLMGWSIQNPNGSITNIHLDPDKTHMAIVIDPSVFKVD